MAKTIFLGIDLSTVNWGLVFYVLFSIVLVAGGCTKLYPMGMPRTVIFAVGSIMVLYFFEQRWFGGKKASNKGVWPPHINTCPDYLTYLPTRPGLTTGGCVDTLGVSSNGAFTRVKDTDLTGTTQLSSQKVFPYTSANLSSIKDVCNACQRSGLTWEGIYDGDKCVGSSSYGDDTSSGPGNCSV
jgi:hypothetical protein